MNPLLFLALVALSGCSALQHGSSERQRIVFLGDSITELGVKPGGYVAIVKDTLEHSPGVGQVEILGAGVDGNRVPDLLARLDRDVIAKQPTHVVIYIGINDVWHWALLNKGTPKEQYRTGLRKLIIRIGEAGATVILCTPSVIGERHDGGNPLDPMLDEYAEISRSVAREMHVHVCDLRRAFVEHLKANNPENKDRGILTNDSVHLNAAGNMFVARQIIAALRQ